MKKYMGMVVFLAMAVAPLLAQAAQDPWVGTWKLNVAKSKFDPGPPPQSESITIGEDGKVTVEGTQQDGTAENWSYMSSQDTEVPITGMPNSTVKEKRSARSIEHTWKFNGGSFTGKGVLARDGKSFTYTLDGTNSQGQHEHNVMVYEKQ